VTEAPEAATAAFLRTLRAAGFEGDLSAADVDRTVLATDNSIYCLVPQAIAFPRGTADLVRTGRLLAEPRFAGVRVEAEAPMAERHNTVTPRSESKN
jgi:hypothetical protein